MDLCRRVIEYEGPLANDYYNQFFNPNICHVCKSVDKGNLISCDECGLISYCTEDHKQIHHIEHMEVCTSASYYLDTKPQNDINRFETWQEWIESRKLLLEFVKVDIDHPLNPYVAQIILWSKTCLICHQQAELRTCKKCFSVNYCNEHEDIFYTKHTSNECNRLTLLLNIKIGTMLFLSINISNDLFLHIDPKISSANLFEFIATYIRNSISKLRTLEFVQTDYFVEPMTIYSGLKRTKLLNILNGSEHTIHIVTSRSAMDRRNVKAWELLLHFLPEMQTLTIVMIGSELKFAYNNIACCYSCQLNNKKLSFVSIPMLYHEYSRASLGYKVPTIVIGFETELNREYIHSESIKVIQAQDVPLLFSSINKYKARDDIVAIQKVLGKPIEPILNSDNFFCGIVPYRNLETGYTYWRNQYLVVFKNLRDSDENQPSTSTTSA